MALFWELFRRIAEFPNLMLEVLVFCQALQADVSRDNTCYLPDLYIPMVCYRSVKDDKH